MALTRHLQTLYSRYSESMVCTDMQRYWYDTGGLLVLASVEHWVPSHHNVLYISLYSCIRVMVPNSPHMVYIHLPSKSQHLVGVEHGSSAQQGRSITTVLLPYYAKLSKSGLSNFRNWTNFCIETFYRKMTWVELIYSILLSRILSSHSEINLNLISKSSTFWWLF